jgi:2-amino-4-hydroxy-6-hydroxymethyldihydropteridine diphosphokinase
MGTGIEAYLLLGGNTGDPVRTLGSAIAHVGDRVGRVQARSRDHWTRPWGFRDERLFLNVAIRISTNLAPEHVLAECLAIEAELGRTRVPGTGPGPRPIDIDLLLYGGCVVNGPGIEVPHPRLHERTFALAPLADIAPAVVHPLLGRPVLALLNDLGCPA